MANRKRQVKELIAKAGLALADGIEQANSGHIKARAPCALTGRPGCSPSP